MEIKPILGVLVIFGFGLASAANDSCTPEEINNVNKCLLTFVMAHRQHQLELIAAKKCKLELLNCTALDAAYTCINGYVPSATCIDSLEDTINSYIADLKIKCTVADFNSHCPDVTKIKYKDTQTTTTIVPDPSSSCRQQSTWILITALFVLSSMLMN